ncbi:hypothetical protein JOC27_001575 [Sporolactobacillus spathodeae]|uniref:Uncharacterized protein n=1 Tax=Sporolactobacillus spathodeae TaxID=1465502 RepID=A0ABS2QAX7_9BACL|nr:hypothetical protein [Sporolactobacillus spathodeae]
MQRRCSGACGKSEPSETPQITACLRRLTDRPRQASDRSAFDTNKDQAQPVFLKDKHVYDFVVKMQRRHSGARGIQKTEVWSR